MTVNLYLPATYQDGFETISGSVWTRLTSYPGSTIAELATALAISEAQITATLDTLEAQRLAIRKYAENGTPYFWKASQYETLIVNNIGAARTWVATNDGGTVAAMATALGVHYGIAFGIAEALRAEGSCLTLYS